MELGTAALPDEITAETQAVNNRQAAADARAILGEDEVRMKNLISRNGTADPLLARVRIVPVDRIVVPEKDPLPPLEIMVRNSRSPAAQAMRDCPERRRLEPFLRSPTLISLAASATLSPRLSAGIFPRRA